jgi:Zn-dependent membrane protease YugP
MIIGFWAQHRVKSTFARNLQVPVANGMTGAQVARQILDRNGLHDVPVEQAPGSLTDHYDPRSRSVHLSEPVYNGVSVASTAVGAHEVGHAIQHAQAYSFFRFRSALFPAVQFASNMWMLLLFGGIILGVLQLAYLGVALFAIAVLFQLVTLPVEFDASRRAKDQLSDLGLVASNEAAGVKSTLTAAAWTYVAAALASVAMLLYYLSMIRR